MVKNKLVLHDISFSILSSYETCYDKIKALMTELKTYLTSEGFNVKYYEDDAEQSATVEVRREGYDTYFRYVMTYYSDTQATLNLGIFLKSQNYRYTTESKCTITNTGYTLLAFYIVTDNFIGFRVYYVNSSLDSQGFDYSSSQFIIKSESGDEYYKYSGSTSNIYKSETDTAIALPSHVNTGNIDKAILNKLPAGTSYLKGVYLLDLPSRGSLINNTNIYGGIYVNLTGYGKFLCFSSGKERSLFAVKLDEEETTA